MTAPKPIDIGQLEKLVRYDSETGRLYIIKDVWGKRAGQELTYSKKRGYLTTWIFGGNYFVHRIAWALFYKEQPPTIIDHINRNRSDNRISNLRAATNGQNMANRQPFSDRRNLPKGISWCKKTGKWRAQICVDGRKTNLGTFKKIEHAEAMYNMIARSAFGEFFAEPVDAKEEADSVNDTSNQIKVKK